MDSILISPKDQEELEYILELLHSMEIEGKTVSAKDKDDFELAQLMKNIDATGIVREESKPIILNYEQIKILEKSAAEMAGKTIVTEKQIQIEEDEWLNK